MTIKVKEFTEDNNDSLEYNINLYCASNKISKENLIRIEFLETRRGFFPRARIVFDDECKEKEKESKREDDWVYHPWAHYYADESFTCDNWYCRRGFKKGVWNKETDYILCMNCYKLYKFYKSERDSDMAISFEFVKKPHAVFEKLKKQSEKGERNMKETEKK